MFTKIEMKNKQENFELALSLARGCFTGPQRHGMIKHVRDLRRHWLKAQS